MRNLAYLPSASLHYDDEDGPATDILSSNDPAMRAVEALIIKAARTPATVLIQGETGTGKEHVAREIHRRSPNRNGPFVVADCPNLVGDLFRNELFGHEKGAFTGADDCHVGLLENAYGGTLFIDEVDRLTLQDQARLLRVIQERMFRRIGGRRQIRVHCRFIVATNKRLRSMVDQGAFGEDLYYRLDVLAVNLPPLRERRDDIIPLANHFLYKYRAFDPSGTKKILRDAAINKLLSYGWPGNVRELENVMQKAIVASEGRFIIARDIPLDMAENPIGNVTDDIESALRSNTWDTAADAFKRAFITRILDESKWNITLASKRIGKHRNTLIGWMNDLGIYGGET